MSGLEAKNADLSVLRIDRAAEPEAGGSPAPRARRWLAIGLSAVGVAVLAAILLWTGAVSPAVPVRLTPATMVSPLESRAALVVEVGTLRALGFQQRSVLAAFLVESVLLALAGGAVGIGLASLLSFARVSTLNFGSFSEIGFGFALSPGVVTSALIFAVVMGVVGGFLPAVRAARLNIVDALRAS